MSRFKSKGQTLKMLRHNISHAKILPIFIFTVADWTTRRDWVIKKTFAELTAPPWIVRSSFSGEDKSDMSNAGAFISVLNVHNDNLETAVNNVISSYNNEAPTEEVFIQPMLKNVESVGVAFSHDPNTGAPDRIINWSKGSNTQAVTAGLAGNVCQIADGFEGMPKYKPLKPLVSLIGELLFIFDETPIDCEFAITREKNKRTLWLLQVRPLVLPSKKRCVAKHIEQLNSIKRRIQTGMKPQPFLIGKRTIYGIMPDWNPAEIIGKRPRPLARTLYQELITDSIWAYQRHNYGYRNLRSYPLMLSFFGVPYIDVRVSFNSFIPGDLDDKIAGRLVDYYLTKLIKHPNLHDKVEFEIVLSCYTFDIWKTLKGLEEYGFSSDDQKIIAHSLLKLTNQILNPENGLWRKDAGKLNILSSKFQIIKSSSMTSIEKIYWLLEDCKRYGTLPFAGLARAAFIGVQMLRSLVNLHIFSEDNYREFMENVATVSSQMTFDYKTMKKNDFLERYGHLRPGTYDILSPRYDEQPELYFNWSGSSEKPTQRKKTFSVTKTQKKKINDLLQLNKINIDADRLLDFISNSIVLREKAKFDFTRNLSEAMLLIGKVGASNGIELEELSYCNVNAFRDLYLSASNIKEVLTESIERGKKYYSDTLALSLPPLITEPDDVMSFEWPRAEPNFITQKKIIAEVTTTIKKDEISNKIVCIPGADPGYDWIFSYPIAGFVTAWGGVNSHMAIRAGEQNVPAVIGAGEVLFRQCASSNRLLLNCAEKRVEIIQ